MNIKSLIITASTLLAVSSSAALADSITVRAQGSLQVGGRVTSGPIVRDHRNDGPIVRDHRHTRPVYTPAPVYADGRNDWRGRDSDDRYNTIRPRPQPQPELLIVAPRVDLRGNLSVYEGWYGSTMSRPGYQVITQPTRIETIREGFNLGNSGLINSIQLQAVRGTTDVSLIGVMYANGEKGFITVNQTLSRSNPVITIDLPGNARGITLINVYGTSSTGSAYQMAASS